MKVQPIGRQLRFLENLPSHPLTTCLLGSRDVTYEPIIIVQLMRGGQVLVSRLSKRRSEGNFVDSIPGLRMPRRNYLANGETSTVDVLMMQTLP